jgi:hypothetical protein
VNTTGYITEKPGMPIYQQFFEMTKIFCTFSCMEDVLNKQQKLRKEIGDELYTQFLLSLSEDEIKPILEKKKKEYAVDEDSINQIFFE